MSVKQINSKISRQKQATTIKSVALYLLAFLIPFSILSLVYLKHGMYPFGEKTILLCDMSGQYVDFYSTYYEILTQGKSILYSWHAGMGLNFLGIFAYYLSSPFSLLIIFFEKQHLTEALLLITLLKIGASGFTFVLYAQYTFKSSKTVILPFSILYALMSYAVVYSFNLMWLDGVIFLPLVLLGTEKILRENKSLFFVFSLISIFLANFYIAYMVGIFSFLYFLTTFFAEHSFKEIRLFARKLLVFGFSALLAAGCAAVLLIPTFYALRNGQGGPDLSLFTWKINFKLFDLLSKAQLGAYDTLKYQGLPNIYCGLLPLILLPLYLANKKIPVKEKILFSSLLGFLIFSFNFSNLDIMWHAFDKPDWFPNRYSFVFSFLLIFLALKGLENLQSSDPPDLIKISVFWIVLIIILQKIKYTYLSDKLLMISIFLLALYTLLLGGFLKLKPRKNILLLSLTGFILLESTLNTWYLVQRMDGEYSYVTKQEYGQTLTKLEPLITEIQTKDPNFYRLDRIGGRTFNDPMNLNYNGITHFSSMSNSEMYNSLRQLGFLTTAGYKSVNFAGSTPLTESLLGIKYVISAKNKGLGYKEIINKGEFKAYKNLHALPLAFLVDKALLELDTSKDNNPFRLQNKLLNLALGLSPKSDSPDYFLPLTLKQTKLTNATISKEKEKEIIRRSNASWEGSVEFTLINPQAQQVYACFQTIDNDVQLFLNEEEIKGYLPVYNKRIVDLGFHPDNKELRIKLSFRNQGFTLAEKYFYGLSEPNLNRALIPLKDKILENVQVTDTSVQGKVRVREKAKTLLFTSIPYDPGWQVLVDGQNASTRKIADAFLGVELKEGQHEISFLFRPKGLRLGLIISGISLVIFVFLIVEDRKRIKRTINK